MKLQNKLSNVYYNICRWLREDLPHLHTDTLIGIKNLIRWFPIIWSTREWDYAYMYEIERHKLKSMLKYFENNKYFDHSLDIRDINVCLTLLDIIMKDDFDEMPPCYVNRKNSNRIMGSDTGTHSIHWDDNTIRRHKALHLYNLIKANKSLHWWD